MNWVPLRVKTDMSLLQAFGKPREFVDKCVKNNYSSCGIANIDDISACVSFYKSCKEKNVKPILGCEFAGNYTVFCKNKLGWKGLIRAVSNMGENVGDFSLMESNYFSDKNHVCITGYYGSGLASAILASGAEHAQSIDHAKSFLVEDWESVASSYVDSLRSWFGDVYLAIDLQDDQFYASAVLAECMRKVCPSIVVASGDVRYLNEDDSDCHKILICSKNKKTLPDIARMLSKHQEFEDKRFFVSNKYYLPESNSLYSFGYLDIEIQNAKNIADLCEEYDILSAPILPKFACPNGMKEIDYLKELCRQGWKTKLNKEQRESPIYIERIRDEELPVIEDADLSGYFLIVQDIMAYVKNRGWLPGAGRGSAAGCLISYLISITQVDPIKYNLLFSRFFNASRKGSLPDIDMDVPAEHRDEIIEYIKNKYGPHRVAQMITCGTLQGKSAIKEVMRIEDSVSFTEMNEITKYIPDEARIADELEEMEDKSIIKWALINNAKYLNKWCILSPDGTLTGELSETFRKAMKIEGTCKSRGKHAAGVIISGEPLENLCPMVKDKDGNKVAGFEMSDLEAIGLVKFDVLGVDILSKIMKVSKNRNLDIYDIYDKSVWEHIFCNGDTKGVFQLESQLGRGWAKKLKPRNIEELSALIALIRPGCLEAFYDGKSMTRHYVDRKNGVDPVKYFHPSLEPILKDTYGVLVYQEQSMMIAREIAGFSLQEADSLRKAMGKKLPELMAKVKKDFMTGCKNTGKVSEEEAAQIFDWIEASQRYSFNKSHSVCYAMHGFWSAYCKNYDIDKFYEVYLNHSKRKQDTQQEIRELVSDAKLHNVDILPPSLKRFYLDFTIIESGKIVFGISHIKHVGEAECRNIINMNLGEDLESLSWMEILMRFGKSLKKQAFIALCLSGVFNGRNVSIPRNQMVYEFDSWKTLKPREIEYIESIYSSKKPPILKNYIGEMVNNLNLTANRKKEATGVYRSLETPTHSVKDGISSIARDEEFYFGVSLLFSEADSIGTNIVNASCKDIFNGVKKAVTIGVKINSIREIKTKNGDNMAFLSVEDSSASLDSLVIFSEAYDQYKSVLYPGNLVIMTGKPSFKDGGSLIIEKVYEAQ